jgi:hypothetical protein
MINPRSAIASSANMRVRAGKRRRLVGRAVPAPQRFAPAPLDTWVDDLDEEFGADSDVAGADNPIHPGRRRHDATADLVFTVWGAITPSSR